MYCPSVCKTVLHVFQDYTHADIKAANILLEKERAYSSAVLVDFGLAHRTTNNVDKPDKKRAHNGTCIFTSTDAHRGNNPSFRGDVEILRLQPRHVAHGTLPW
uniref:non-specific serine/threonine protein kinase n=1 Tax=Caenorhabditis japonica TaxID=281687 RepID=A0A8R1HKF4_CAEJA